jgi:DNA-binding response OmpR family regulator
MILKVLAEHGGEIVSREDLLEKVWGMTCFPRPARWTISSSDYASASRRTGQPRHFLTVWGVGYRFLAAGEP